MHKALPCINHVSASHRYEHDGQRKRVAHMPTATTTEAASRFTIGLKAPTRLRDEALKLTVVLTYPHTTFRPGSLSRPMPEFRLPLALTVPDVHNRVPH